MKIKKLALAALPLAATIGTVATVASCQKPSDTVTMDYDQAKAWVKTNYGETEKDFEKPSSVASTWDMSGELTAKGKSDDETILKADVGYLPMHVTGLFNTLGFISKQASEIGYSHTTNTKTYEIKTSVPVAGTVTPTADNFYAPLTTANFDSILSSYFMGLAGKSNTKFIASGKTLKMVGVLSTYTQGTGGINIFSMTNCIVSFDSKGRMTSVEFNFTSNGEAEYIWNATKAINSDWFDFSVNKDSKVSFKYTYTD